MNRLAIMRPLFGVGAMLLASLSISQTKAAWTTMMYLDADNDLEAGLCLDALEAMAVGSTEQFRIIALIDRHKSTDEFDTFYDGELGGIENWTTAKLVEIQAGKLREIADWGEVDMGSSLTLRRFVDESLKLYPAERTHLILSDHGAGWMPGWFDDDQEDQFLTQTELRTAFEGITRAHGKTDLVTFDACLMASVETLFTMNGMAEYVVASEELVPGLGFNYTEPLAALKAEPQMSTRDFAIRFANESYRYYLDDENEKIAANAKSFTIAVLDPAQAVPMRQALEGLAKHLATAKSLRKEAADEIRRVQVSAFTFGEDMGPFGVSAVDLGHVLDLFIAKPPLVDSVAFMGEIKSQLKRCVIHSVKGEAITRADGLSFFWPRFTTFTEGGGPYDYHFAWSNRDLKEWSKYAHEYAVANQEETETPTVGPGKRTIPIRSPQQQIPQFEFTYDPENTARGFSFFARKSDDDPDEIYLFGLLPYEIDDSGVATLPWLGGWLAITDSERTQIAPISHAQFNDDGAAQSITGRLTLPGREPVRAVLTFWGRYDDTEADLIRITIFEEQRIRVVLPEDGMEFQPLYGQVNLRTGDYREVFDADSEPLVYGEKGFDLKIVALPEKEYLFGFLAEGWNGEFGGSYIEVRPAP
ncbi:MAG: hypothetical protein KF812_08150 [Fimbriimonadaceae bacterium]|nr:hypothetical protein [Fimbriimonadaceae bacterium]